MTDKIDINIFNDLRKIIHAGEHWYTIQIIPGHENMIQKAIDGLKLDKLLEVFIPSIATVREQRGKKINVVNRLVSGYIMLRISDIDKETISAITRIENVGKFLGERGRPAIVADEEIEALKTQIEHREKNFIDMKNTFNVHEVVKIISGPFEGFSATIESLIPNKDALRAAVSIFGRESLIELSYSQIKKIENS